MISWCSSTERTWMLTIDFIPRIRHPTQIHIKHYFSDLVALHASLLHWIRCTEQTRRDLTTVSLWNTRGADERLLYEMLHRMLALLWSIANEVAVFSNEHSTALQSFRYVISLWTAFILRVSHRSNWPNDRNELTNQPTNQLNDRRSDRKTDQTTNQLSNNKYRNLHTT
jgi:hypothetical protein